MWREKEIYAKERKRDERSEECADQSEQHSPGREDPRLDEVLQ